jgi:hypothetical protein
VRSSSRGRSLPSPTFVLSSDVLRDGGLALVRLRRGYTLIKARDVLPDEPRYWTLASTVDEAMTAAGNHFHLHTVIPTPHDADDWNAVVAKDTDFDRKRRKR